MPCTILVADDSRTTRTLIRMALEPDRHRVLEAADGRTALAVADAAGTDLVITDINMPEMDGLALIRELRARSRYRLTPILVLTTESGVEMKRRGREAGATGWIVKPFEAEHLRLTVSHVLTRTAS